MNYNPTTREVKEYIAEMDPTNSKRISKEKCMKLVDRRAGNPDTYEELLEGLLHFDKT